MPGETNGVHTLQVNGELITDKARIDSALSHYWKKVFTKKATSTSARDTQSRWLADASHDFHPPEQINMAKKIRGAIKHSNNSAAGPDGIPYAAYRTTARLSGEVLTGVLGDLTSEGPWVPESFNVAVMACLPKKPAGTDPIHGDYYTPENTRPLSIVNTDNRLLAAALKRTLEKPADEWVSEAQQGFIPGRSMISNILQVDKEAKSLALAGKKGAIILFDFAAAFPSVDQGFLLKVLESVGCSGIYLNAIKKFYLNNRQQIGSAEFVAEAGIRQGCPLSPLLFAIVADILLRKLASEFPGCGIRAFADDTAMVIDDIALLPKIMDLFKEYEGFSHLGLNLKKTVIIPLYDCELEDEKIKPGKTQGHLPHEMDLCGQISWGHDWSRSRKLRLGRSAGQIQ